MGNEIKGAVRTGKTRNEGRILLETSEIIFRGADYRLKIAFNEMRNVTAASGELKIETDNGTKVFEIGSAAEKWREKILHPKTRAEKLGVKPGTTVRLLGEFAADFLKELKVSKAKIVQANGSARADNTFFAVDNDKSLVAAGKFAKMIKNAETLWVVYPKGRKEITENDVIGAGRKAGLKDVKVVGFSGTHTALKFVLPLNKR